MGILIIIITGAIIGGLIGLFSSDFPTAEDIFIGSILGGFMATFIAGISFLIYVFTVPPPQELTPSSVETYELQSLSDEIYVKQISEYEEYAYLIKDDNAVSITGDYDEIIIIEVETITPTVKIETYELNKKYIFSIPPDSFQKFRENENRIS